MCMAESLPCSPKTITTLISYIPIQNKKLKKYQFSSSPVLVKNTIFIPTLPKRPFLLFPKLPDKQLLADLIHIFFTAAAIYGHFYQSQY